MSLREKRIGEKYPNKNGSIMMIIGYRNAQDVDVVFIETEYKVYNCTMREIKEGVIKHPYDKTVFNVGYIGVGTYSKENDTLAYRKWRAMLERCHDTKLQEKYPTYKECKIYKEWYCFQNFAKWFYENYYEVEGCCWMDLDKDILIKNNKIYSPETCIFVPHEINILFTKADKNRGKYPIGVTYSKYHNKFETTLSINGKCEKKRFNTIEETFNYYKTEKEKYIKEVADQYKPYIPTKLYEAMYNYKVEITD